MKILNKNIPQSNLSIWASFGTPLCTLCGTWFEVRRLCKLALCYPEGAWGPCACAMPHPDGLLNLNVATDLHDDTQFPRPYSQSIPEMPFAACSPFCEFIIIFLIFTPSIFYVLFKARGQEIDHPTSSFPGSAPASPRNGYCRRASTYLFQSFASC